MVIRTADRSPRRNYLLDTLFNLERSGVFTSNVPAQIGLFDTGGSSGEHINQAALWADLHASINPVFIVRAKEKLTPNQNAIAALKGAALSGAEWCLFLEDDIDVCADFLESVDAWLKDHARENCLVYPLCAAYGEKSGRKNGKPWHYPISAFYGTQAYAIRAVDAEKMALWMEEKLKAHPMGQGHDLLVKEWSLLVNPENPHFLAPTPDFVQHIGEESSLHLGRFHQYAMFGGQTWRYPEGHASYFTLAEHTHSKMSKGLAELLVKHLPKDSPVYDLGCGPGRYVQALQHAGFNAFGIEGTPGIKTIAKCDNIHCADLGRPLGSLWKKLEKGSVISIEVGEHIPKKAESVFLDNIDLLCKDHLVLTWAVRGQGGRRHVNEQDADELLPKLNTRGYVLNESESKRFREVAGQDFFWFKRSIYVLRRE